MSLARLHIPALANGEKLSPADFAGLGRGRIFYVMAVATAGYAKFFTDHNVVDDADRTNSVYNTIDAAISACTAGRGDTIFVSEGHTETVTATSIALDVAGVTVIGLGNGTNRPVLTFSTAGATITVTGANCAWHNIDHLGNAVDVASAFTIGAAIGFLLEGNTFREGSAVLNFLSIVTTGAVDNEADNLKVFGNSWDSRATATLAFVSILAAERNVRLEDNYVIKASTSNVGHFFTLAAKVVTNFRVMRNILVIVGDANATVGIFATGSSTTNTGIVAYNLVNSLDTTTELIMTAALNLAQFENYYTGTITATGKLWPVVDAA